MKIYHSKDDWTLWHHCLHSITRKCARNLQTKDRHFSLKYTCTFNTKELCWFQHCFHCHLNIKFENACAFYWVRYKREQGKFESNTKNVGQTETTLMSLRNIYLFPKIGCYKLKLLHMNEWHQKCRVSIDPLDYSSIPKGLPHLLVWMRVTSSPSVSWSSMSNPWCWLNL